MGRDGRSQEGREGGEKKKCVCCRHPEARGSGNLFIGVGHTWEGQAQDFITIKSLGPFGTTVGSYLSNMSEMQSKGSGPCNDQQ